MKERVKNILTRILFRLLDVPTVQADDKIVELWLADAYQNPGARKYVATRVQLIKDELAGGIGMTELPRDGYVRMIGQRFEVLRFLQRAKTAYQRTEKARQEKIDNSKAKA